jgi:hypothetical protein
VFREYDTIESVRLFKLVSVNKIVMKAMELAKIFLLITLEILIHVVLT